MKKITSLGETLEVDGATTLHSKLTVTDGGVTVESGDVVISDNLHVDKVLTVHDLIVDGTTTTINTTNTLVKDTIGVIFWTRK